MTLNERVAADMKEAMKAGDRLRLETLRTLRAMLIEMSKRGEARELSLEDELTVVMAAVKKRTEAAEVYRMAGRNELAELEEQEREILSAYLPKPISREEAANVVARIVQNIGQVGARQFGTVMSLAMKELKGRIDGKVVQEIVKSQLQG